MDRYDAGLMGGVQLPLIEWQPRRALQAIDETLEALKKMGVRVPAGCRLELARDAIRRVESLNVQFGHGDTATERMYAEAHRTVFEQYLIVRELQPPNEAARRALTKMLGGPLVPVPGRHDKARDKQAEFFAGVMLYACGFHVDFGGADLLLTNRESKLSAAVKRVTSAKNFQKKIRIARNQLITARRAGFIVVSADQFLEEVYASDRTADLSAAHYHQLAEWADHLHLERARNPVIGVIAMSTSFRHVPRTPSAMQVVLHFHQRFITWHDPDQLRAAKNVGSAFAGALARKLEAVFGPHDQGTRHSDSGAS